ncbi:ATP-binding protein [Thiohalocapsa marina]|uniref:ATP-binding protein n=1 Tax=Thiohalocapsa marina TaxID=424902 RepID=A0A5M8FVH9_9GAMM|nr:ATP-binding protein [Thiohalocapsa marina]KAA6187817.1 ATP-binding protein [Thiohalocapsa marina]
MTELDTVLTRAEGLLGRLELLLPVATEPDWSARAWRWRRNGSQGRGAQGWLEAVHRPHRLQLSDLCCIDAQRDEIDRNTRQFLAGAGANNVLLWGSRGTGKSSLIKALFNTYQNRGLRLIEIDKDDLIDLPSVLDLIHGRPERFILYCDDLSFEAGESGYKALKAVLDGSISAPPDNLLIYATSNRRHLLPEFQRENQASRLVDGEIHHGEGIEEKISLSDRFGLWLSFRPFSQQDYLSVCHHWLGQLQADAGDAAQIERAALQWALRRGSRSGRTAWQFARDWAGRQRLSLDQH